MLISNIQHFSVHDGPGIRTTVFLKGCPLSCPWCANPENISSKMQYMFLKNKCVKDKEKCMFNEKCKVLQNCQELNDEDARNCPLGAIAKCGIEWNENELIEELAKDKIFYGEDGGITFSGGEPLLHMEQLTNIIAKLKQQGIDVCVESSLFIDQHRMQEAIKHFDRFIVDIKIMNTKKCKEILHGDIDIYMKNLKMLSDSNKPYVMRFPLVPGYTDDDENINEVVRIVNKYKPDLVEIFSVHNLAESKYWALGRKYTVFQKMKEEQLYEIKCKLIDKKVETKIITI